MIKLIYTEPGNGGSQIVNYEVQMDDGLGGGFNTIAGGDNQVYLYNYFTATAITRRLSILPIY
jgi:hypothetical protein